MATATMSSRSVRGMRGAGERRERCRRDANMLAIEAAMLATSSTDEADVAGQADLLSKAEELIHGALRQLQRGWL